MRTPEQNLDGVMAYLRQAEPKREAFESVTRADLDILRARLDCIEQQQAELEARLDALE